MSAQSITETMNDSDLAKHVYFYVLQALVMRFPEPLVEEWAPVFFMALVARLVNDPSVACRAMHEQALQTLLQVQFRGFASCLARTVPCLSAGYDEIAAILVQPMLCEGYFDLMSFDPYCSFRCSIESGVAQTG